MPASKKSRYRIETEAHRQGLPHRTNFKKTEYKAVYEFIEAKQKKIQSAHREAIERQQQPSNIQQNRKETEKK